METGKSHWHVSVFVQRRREMSVPTQPLELLSFPSPTAHIWGLTEYNHLAIAAQVRTTLKGGEKLQGFSEESAEAVMG